MKVETESKGLGSSKEDKLTEVLIPVLSGRRTRPRSILSRRVRHSVGSTGHRSRVTQFVSRHVVASFRPAFIFAAGRFEYRIGAKPYDRPAPIGRSEEHTSELQSHLNLVCRLLLEKKHR